MELEKEKNWDASVSLIENIKGILFYIVQYSG